MQHSQYIEFFTSAESAPVWALIVFFGISITALVCALLDNKREG